MSDDSRIVDLDEFGDDCDDKAIITLQMLVKMHGESHRLWRITPSAGGAWNYEKFHGKVPEGLKADVFKFTEELSAKTGVKLDPEKVWADVLSHVADADSDERL